MFGLGMPELIIILVIGLLVFGAGRLPEIGNSLGKAIKGFREASDKREPEPPAPTGEANGSAVRCNVDCRLASGPIFSGRCASGLAILCCEVASFKSACR